jgi:hypothetical protein
MKRCIECGRRYRGGLNAPALLELALDELSESELEAESIRDLIRMRALARRVSDRIDAAVSAGAERMSRGANGRERQNGSLCPNQGRPKTY